MLDRDDYREGWKKKAWCVANGYIEDTHLFTSTEGPGPGPGPGLGLGMAAAAAVAVVADRVRKALDRWCRWASRFHAAGRSGRELQKTLLSQ